MTRRLGQPFVLLAMLAVSACEGPTAPPVPPDAPTLTCPSSVSVVSPDGAPVPINYTVPTPVNGQPPVAVLCSKSPGSAFPVGSTIVTCTATDSLTRQGSCNFNVSVTVIPKISKTKFLAFGDSITYGRCGPRGPGEICPTYSVRLAELLRARYTQQTFVVTTEGLPGETAACHEDNGKCGEDRLPGVLNAVNPEVLLLMEGTNDLNGGASQVPEALESLEDMMNLALARQMKVVIATIPPIRPGGANNSTIPLVAPFNSQIRNLVATQDPQKVALADVFLALNADLARYYDPGDDLHPLAEGHRVIGETFYAAVRALLDITPPGGSFSPVSSGTGLFEPPARPRFVKKLPGR